MAGGKDAMMRRLSDDVAIAMPFGMGATCQAFNHLIPATHDSRSLITPQEAATGARRPHRLAPAIGPSTAST